MGRAAPVARCALAFAAGVAAGLSGAPLWLAPTSLLLFLCAPIQTSWRRARWVAAVVVMGAGWTSGAAAFLPSLCAPPPPSVQGVLSGRFLATPRDGSAPFARGNGCDDVTVVVPPTASASRGELPRAGFPVTVHGSWREGSRRPWFRGESWDADHAQALRDGRGRGLSPGRGLGRALREAPWLLVRWRDDLVERVRRLYGDQAPLVAALTLARRDALDSGVREAFAVTGVAHLLAISGFHVGVVSALAFAVLRLLGSSRRGASLQASTLAWMYVALLGFPDSGFRAALILGLVAVSRARGRPPSRWGALGAAALILLALDPTRLGEPGFQLSFAGAAGLVAWARPLQRVLESAWRAHLRVEVPRALLTAIATGVAATLATLPVVAWHFERVSLIGIPATLLASPIVSLALPGALLSLALDFVAPAAAAYVAGGVSLLLEVLEWGVRAGASLPFVSVWASRATVIAGLVGGVIASGVARHPRIGAQTRRSLVALYVVGAAVGWPLVVGLELRGSVELWMIDVGQGDAIALRTPRGRWLLVDAGPPPDGDPRAHPVVRALRSRGVSRLEALVLTHADADHFGGAASVLQMLPVGQVIDPTLPAGKRGYLDAIAAAVAAEVPWRAARQGQVLEVDGVVVRILHPTDSVVARERNAGTNAEANATSVVLLVSWRGFDALLTGDAYKDVERAIAPGVGDIDVLKVGHHGSETSTDAEFLALTRPEFALVSVGRRNRYGHPSPDVLARLAAAGAEIHRTDQEGDIRMLVRRDGQISLRSER